MIMDNLVFNQLFKNSLCIIYLNKIVVGLFVNEPMNKGRHYVLAIIPGLLRYHSIMNQ